MIKEGIVILLTLIFPTALFAQPQKDQQNLIISAKRYSDMPKLRFKNLA